jgi:SAM-dependent methyltransferase
MTENRQYIGTELELFAAALNWKAYIRRQIGLYIKGHVLEVGAGIGETTKALLNGHIARWTCLEPDQKLAERMAVTFENIPAGQRARPEIIVGDIDHPACDREFDTILYIDVLEHIENDALELNKAARKLKRKGHLIVLAPAHPYLFSPFDDQIGHFRRYRQQQLMAISPANTRIVKIRYLDSVGCLASLGNKLILKAGNPTNKQIMIWDRVMIPFSRFFDFIFCYRLGKSIFAVWQKSE